MINKQIFEIFWRELRKVAGDRNLALIFIVAPLIYPLFYGSIYINKAESEIPVAIMDCDNSYLSRSLVRTLDAHQNINISLKLNDESEIGNVMAGNKAANVVYIPKGFEENLKKGIQASVTLYLNPARLLVLSDAGIPATQLITAFGAKVTANVLGVKGVPVFQDSNYAQPLKFDFSYIHNPYLTYGDMILLPLMIIIISQLVLIGVTSATAKEYNMNGWNESFRAADGIFNNYAGRLLFYLLLFAVFSILLRFTVADFLNISKSGSDWNSLVVFLLGIIANTAFGLFLGTFFRHRVAVFITLGFTSYPFFLMSGYAWPARQIPEIIGYFSLMFPSTPFLRAGFDIIETGAPLTPGTLHLLNFSILIFLYSVGFLWRLKVIKKRDRISSNNRPQL